MKRSREIDKEIEEGEGKGEGEWNREKGGSLLWICEISEQVYVSLGPGDLIWLRAVWKSHPCNSVIN